MSIKRIVGMSGSGMAIAEMDNGIYVWVPTFEKLDVNQLRDSREKGERLNAYAVSWLFWAKWTPVFPDGMVKPELQEIAMNNFDTLLREYPFDGTNALGVRMNNDSGAEAVNQFKDDEAEVEKWANEHPEMRERCLHPYDFVE